MRRTRAVGLTALAAAVTLVVAACSGTPGQQSTTTTDGGTAAPSGSAAATGGASGGTDATSLPGAENVGKVGGSGCGIPHGAYDTPADPGGEVRVAWNDPLLSFNINSSHGNATANKNPIYLTNQGFSYYDADLNYINNDQFGTCEVISLDPLTVKYTVNEGVTWSDGVQIGAADMVLSWAALSGNFNDGEAEVVTDEATGESTVVAGEGIAFDASEPGSQLIKEFPEIGDDGRSATFKWSEFFVDFPTGNPVTEIGALLPAHVVAKKALGIADNAQASEALIEAFRTNDKAKIKPISDFWNTGFDTDQLPSDPELYLSSGPYKVTSYAQRAAMTFERNESYDWGPKAIADKINYLVIGDPTAAVQALTNEEVDIIAPQATADIYQSVAGLADRGVEVKTGYEGTYEQVPLIIRNGGPFDPATYGGDEEKALKVRQAFLKTIPRQDIVDRLIKPINPDAAVRNSQTTVPGAPAYDQIVAENGSDAYAQVDIEGAKALLAEVGVATPVNVRLKYAANNPRRANEYDLMQKSAAQAGFNLIDGQSASWVAELPATDTYDAALYGLQSEAVALADAQPNFVTGGQNNYGEFSNQVVDDSYSKLLGQSLPQEEQTQLLIAIEKELWGDAYGVTIFQFPSVVSWNTTKVTGVDAIALSPAVFYNFWEWQPVS